MFDMGAKITVTKRHEQLEESLQGALDTDSKWTENIVSFLRLIGF